jgi:hypothetical protein
MKNEGAPKEFTWSEIKLLNEIKSTKDYIKNCPKENLESAQTKLAELEGRLNWIYKERKKMNNPLKYR